MVTFREAEREGCDGWLSGWRKGPEGQEGEQLLEAEKGFNPRIYRRKLSAAT